MATKLDPVEAARKRLPRYVKRGGFVVRDVVGGAVGVRWTRAARTGGWFNPAKLELALELGVLKPVRGAISIFQIPPPPLMVA